MKIEKLNENKIRIIFNNTDLKNNNIDEHSFMANSIESQKFFLNILDQAEHEIGFITDNYKLCIDAIALKNGNFIITVTRIEKELLKSTRVHARKKDSITNNNLIIYKFLNLDDFFSFENLLLQTFPNYIDLISNNTQLYKCNNLFFLILKNEYLKDFLYILSEFAIPVHNSELFVDKIIEYGTLIS